MKEGKQAVKMTRLSCHLFRSNEVQLLLSLIAYNLRNLGRRLLPTPREAVGSTIDAGQDGKVEILAE